MSEAKIFCAHDEVVEIDSLKPNPSNPNRHPKEQIRMFAKILLANGWRRPVVVSKRSGLVVKGHGAILAAREAGLSKVPVNFQDYKDAKAEIQDMLADNELARLASNGDEELKALLEELDGTDLELAGFDSEALRLALQDFQPVPMEEKSRLDMKAPVICPKCGHEFAP